MEKGRLMPFSFFYIMMKLFIFFFGMVCLLLSCATETEIEPIANPEDYNPYLHTSERSSLLEAENEVAFWSKRLRPDSSGVGDLGPLASAYSRLFDATGNATYLTNAETLYKKAMAISANNKDIYARGLARTYISQHRFKEAATLLKQSYEGVSSKRATQFMLFDVLMELGKYEEAESYLKLLNNTSDYNYLIRKAKWSDHTGDLTNAINYMESAKAIAESRNSKPLKIWTYSNLGDYYGHDGRIDQAYKHYLMTLELQPDNTHVKKGIAWINYAYQNNATEARRILDSVMKIHKIPDYYLFLAEMAENEGEEAEAAEYTEAFINAATNEAYGRMYNTYLVEVLAEKDPNRAMAIAEVEITERATPETYSLLAYTKLMKGEKERALEIIESRVKDKTSEPMAAYYMALVYQANGRTNELQQLKKELQEAAFELGPVLTKKINKF